MIWISSSNGTNLLFFWQSDDAYNPDRMYDLVAVVVHIGSSINRGHYISIVKSEDIWILFDDDIVDVSTFNSLGNDIRCNSQTQYDNSLNGASP